MTQNLKTIKLLFHLQGLSMIGFLGLAAVQVFTYSTVNNDLRDVKERLQKVERVTSTNSASSASDDASAASASSSIASFGNQIMALGRKKRSVDAEESFDNEREGRNLVSETVYTQVDLRHKRS